MFKVTCSTYQMTRQRSKAFKCIFDILFASQYISLLNGAVGGREKGWFLMDLSVKASFGNSNHQMFQLPTAGCCHVQEKHIPEITILHIQKEHLQSLTVSSDSSIIQPSHCNANMSNQSLNFRAIHSYLCITIFTILKYSMSLDLYPASNKEKKQCVLKGPKLLLPFCKSTFTTLGIGQPEQSFSHILSPLL